MITTSATLKAHHHQLKLMGCGFTLTAVSADPQHAWDAIRAGVAEIDRIERLISSWRTDTFTHRINQQAGIAPVAVPNELYGLIHRSLKVSQLTFGAFDISGTVARDHWKFDGGEHPSLNAAEIAELKRVMGYRKIGLDEGKKTVFLKEKGIKIGFGGIGKGYAARRAMDVMRNLGIESGLVNASGDLMAWGSPPQGGDWAVMVRDPEHRETPLLTFGIPYGSVVTSGNDENYTVVEGRRLSHIVDPRTGWPVEALKCVSVLSPDPELGDALATAISVLGVRDGLDLINRLRGIEALVIDQHNQQYFSNHFNQFAHVSA